MEKPNQLHTLKLLINVKKIMISVRFPCSLTFQIKQDSKCVQNKGSYDLKNGQCIIRQTLQIQTDFEYNLIKKCYQEKRVSLIVFMSSTTGKIPAGNIQIPTPMLQDFGKSKQQTLQLDKCPDRTARIIFQLSNELVRKSNIVVRNRGQSYSSTISLDNRKNINHSSVSRFQNRFQKHPFPQSKFNDTNQNGDTRSVKLNSKIQGITGSKVSQFDKQTANFDKQIYKERQKQRQREFIEPAVSQSRLSRVSSNVSQVMIENQQTQISDQRSKIMKLQKQRIQYIKQLAKMKGEVASLKNQEELVQQLDKIKEQNDQLIQKIEKYQEKIKQLQKKEKQYQVTIKQYKQELDKYKANSNISQTKTKQFQKIHQTKQKSIQQLQKTIQHYQTTIQELNSSVNNLQKKSELKQNTYKEQLKKSSEKLNNSQSQRQKAVFDLNNLLTDLDNNEKKYQTTIKDKQRVISQQRSKYNKKIEGLNAKITNLQIQISQKESERLQNTQKYQKLQAKIQDIECQNHRLQDELQLASECLKKEKADKTKLQNNIQQLRLSKKQQKNQLQKKIGDIVTQNSKAKLKLEEILQNNLKYKQEIDILQSQIAAKNNEINQNAKILLKLESQLASSKIHDDKKQKQSQNLSVMTNNARHKINQLNNKIQFHKEQYNQIQIKHQNQITQLINQKDQIEIQLQELRWTIQTEKENQQKLLDQFKLLNKQKVALQQVNITLTSKSFEMENQVKYQQNQLLRISEKLAFIEAKQRQANLAIKQKNQRLSDFQKRTLQLERTILKLNDKIIQYEIICKNKDQSEKEIQKTQFSPYSQTSSYSLLQTQINRKKDHIAMLEREIKNSNQKNVELNQVKENLKIQLHHQQNLLNESQSSNQFLQQKIDLLNKEVYQKIQQILNLRKSQVKIKKQYQQYHQMVYEMIRQVIKHFSLQDETIKFSISSDEVKLSSLLLQIINSKNALASNFKRKLSDLQSNNNILNAQILKSKQYEAQRDQQYSKQIQKQKAQLRNIISINEEQIKRLQSKIQAIQEQNRNFKAQIDKIKGEKLVFYQENEELRMKAQSLFRQRQNQNLNIKNLQENLQRIQLDLKRQQNKVIQMSKRRQEKQPHEKERQKNRQTLIELQQKYYGLERSILQKNDQIKMLELEHIHFKQQIKILQDNLDLRKKELKESSIQRAMIEKEKENLINLFKSVKPNDENIALQKQKSMIDLRESQKQCQKYQKQIQEKETLIVKLQMQIQELNLTYQQLEKNTQDKLQKNKLNTEKQNNQIKSLSEKLIQLNSDFEIKQFLMRQQQKTIESQNQIIQGLKSQIVKRKHDNIKLDEDLQITKAQVMHFQQQIQRQKFEYQAASEELQQNKIKIASIQAQLLEYVSLKQLILLKDKQLAKIRQDIANSEKHYGKSMNEMRASMAGTRKEIYARGSKQEEQRVKIRELQRLLQEKNLDLDLQRMKWQADAEQQKRQMQMQLSLLQNSNKLLQEEYDSVKQSLNNEIETITNQCLRLQNIITEKDSVIKVQQAQILDYQGKVNDLTKQLKNCLQLWDNQKKTYFSSKKQLEEVQKQMSRFQHYATELDGRSKQLIQISKKKTKDQSLPSINDVLRQVSIALIKTKTKALSRTHIQTQKHNLINDFQAVQEKIDSALRSQYK